MHHLLLVVHDFLVLVQLFFGCRSADHVPVLQFEQEAIVGSEEDLAHDVGLLDDLDQVYDVQVAAQQLLALLQVDVFLRCPHLSQRTRLFAP